MIGTHSLTVVIPCYNERDGIALLLSHMPPEVDAVVVVDNASTDGSGDIARAMGAEVVLEPRKGYGNAYKRGLRCARGDIIGTMDGDGSYRAEDIVKLARILVDEKLDFISGSRFPLGDWEAMHMKNFLGNIVLTAVLAILFGLKLNDSQSGLWVFRREILNRISPGNDGMAFSEEIKLEAYLVPSIRCSERHIGYLTRTGKVKLHAFRDGCRNLMFLLKRRLRGR